MLVNHWGVGHHSISEEMGFRPSIAEARAPTQSESGLKRNNEGIGNRGARVPRLAAQEGSRTRRDLLMRSLVGITLLAGYTAAQAQDYGRYRDDDRYYDRDDRGYRRGGGFFV